LAYHPDKNPGKFLAWRSVWFRWRGCSI